MSRVAVVAATMLVLVFSSVAVAATKRLSASEDGHLHFSKKRITVKHGKVTLKMANPATSNLEHSISIRGHGVKKLGKVVGPGSTSKVRVRLRPGTYTFYCHVGDHEAEGMKGKLVVK